MLAGKQLHSQYISAQPFPNITIDNFLPERTAEALINDFPTHINSNDFIFNSSFGGLHKRQISIDQCNDYYRNFFYFFNSAPILQFLEGLTGKKGLIGDPYFTGGGLHETTRNGKFAIHSDFQIYEKLKLVRRVNILIYLNKDWQESYFGNLELWDTKCKKLVKSIAPIFNRCVIFNTSSNSYHGHPVPLNTPFGVSRKSIALYYYTSDLADILNTAPHNTMYQHMPTDSFKLILLAFISRQQNYLKDFLPPIIFRQIYKLKNYIFNHLK